MARILRDELDYCRKQGLCYDCHSENTFKPAVEFQTRGRLEVPCCCVHSYAYRNKINRANNKKYARSSEVKRKARECTYKGCDHKLIPQELVPPWWKRERTCGLHGAFKAFRVNREALLRFILQNCLTPEEREGMTAQNIIYYAEQGYILVGLGRPGLYQTKCFSASGLFKRYKQFRGRKSQPVERNLTYPSS